MRAWRDLPGLRDPERFDAWLHRLTVHACIDAARHRRRRPIEVELTPLDGPTVTDSRPRSSTVTSSTAASGRSSPSGARSSSCTTTWGCRCRRWRTPWGSRWAPPSRGCTGRSACCAARSAPAPRPSPPWSRKDGWHDPDRSIRARSARRPRRPGRRAHPRLLHRHPRADRPFTAAACLGDPRKVVPRCLPSPARPALRRRRDRASWRSSAAPSPQLARRPERRRAHPSAESARPSPSPTRARCRCRVRSSAVGWPRYGRRSIVQGPSRRSSSALGDNPNAFGIGTTGETSRRLRRPRDQPRASSS